MASGIRQTDKCGNPGHTYQVGLRTRRGDPYTLWVKRGGLGDKEKNRKEQKRTKNEIEENNGNCSVSIVSEIMINPSPSQIYVVRRREELDATRILSYLAHFLIP